MDKLDPIHQLLRLLASSRQPLAKHGQAARTNCTINQMVRMAAK